MESLQPFLKFSEENKFFMAGDNEFINRGSAAVRVLPPRLRGVKLGVRHRQQHFSIGCKTVCSSFYNLDMITNMDTGGPKSKPSKLESIYNKSI